MTTLLKENAVEQNVVNEKKNGIHHHHQEALNKCLMEYLANSLSDKCVDLIALQKKIIKEIDLVIEKLSKSK